MSMIKKIWRRMEIIPFGRAVKRIIWRVTYKIREISVLDVPRRWIIIQYKKHKKKAIEKVIMDYSSSQSIPLFSSIEIETINRCNGSCSFCPVNKNSDTREYAKMSEALFDKILKELADLHYEGNVCLFSNNEPFLDERIESFAKKARSLLPNAYISIFTNGTLLSLDRYKNIIPYLDVMIIDNYNDKLKLNSTTKRILDYCRNNPEANKKTRVNMIKTNLIRNTRGGQAPNNSQKIVLPISCLLPWRQLIVRPNGKISLCCADALGKYTLGDVNEQTLKEIWYSEEYERIRERLKLGREGRWPL